jgi:hyperosmotically inducible periplasmic protein
LNDGWLWVKTRFDLAAADDLRDSTINVDVDNAVVTLTGTVASAAQKTRADQVTKSVEGVKSVKNQLRVAPANANANANARR